MRPLTRGLVAALPLLIVSPACKKKEAPPTASPVLAQQPRPTPAPTPTAPLLSAAPNPEVAQLKKAYLDGLFRAKPHLATFMGDHRFDSDLPDDSAAAVQKRVAELTAQAARVAGWSGKPLTQEDQVDLEIVKDGIALELLYLREIKEWTWDPRQNDSFPFYDPRDIVAGRLADIIHGTFAPEAARKTSVVAQLGKLPAYLVTQKAALDAPPDVYLDHGIKNNAGRIEFFDKEVRAFIKGDAAAEKALADALVALRDYQTFLKAEQAKPARKKREWRLGDALYRKKFPLALQTQLTPDELVKRARAAFEVSRKALFSTARALHQKSWPSEKPAAEDPPAAAQKALIERVKNELTKDHPKADELVAAHGKRLDALREFIVQKDLLALPPKETLSVEPMPLFKRGSAGAEYLAPNVLDRAPAWKATYYVDPVDPTWPKAKVESYLRASNDYQVELIAAHEAYPGHHTQAWYSRRSPNDLRAVLWNGPFAEGWAMYGEEVMVHNGYGGERNLRYRFFTLQGQMVSATNTLIDVLLHTGQMKGAEAVAFMVEEGFQERAAAEKKLVRAKLDSTQLCQYFLGLTEIMDLERDYKAKGSFKQRAFNEALLAHGTIAVKFLRPLVLKTK